jgi:hypothetical protein
MKHNLSSTVFLVAALIATIISSLNNFHVINVPIINWWVVSIFLWVHLLVSHALNKKGDK